MCDVLYHLNPRATKVFARIVNTPSEARRHRPIEDRETVGGVLASMSSAQMKGNLKVSRRAISSHDSFEVGSSILYTTFLTKVA